MQVAFTTYSTPDWTPEVIAEQAAALGFDAVELRTYEGHHVPSEPGPEELRRLRTAFASRGVPLCALGTSCQLAADGERRVHELEEARRYLRLAGELGAPILRVFGGPHGEGGQVAAVRRVAEALGELAEPARAAGVRLALETHDAFSAGALVGEVLRQVDHPYVGACWDWLHPFRAGETLAETYGHLRGRVVHTHTKDAAQVDGRWEARYFGEGQLPLAEILGLLVADGYDGPLSLEWEPRGKDPHPERALAQYVPAIRRLLAAHRP
jgi:sugar phosphate isomerase/epimerase